MVGGITGKGNKASKDKGRVKDMREIGVGAGCIQ